MEASRSPPIYCFVLFSYLNLLQFTLISCTHELWRIWLLKTKQKEKTTNPRLKDLLAKKIRDSQMQKLPWKKQSLRPIKNASEISRSGQNFPRPTFFEIPFYTPTLRGCAAQHSIPFASLTLEPYRTITFLFVT